MAKTKQDVGVSEAEAVTLVRLHIRAPHAVVCDCMKWAIAQGLYGERGGGSGPIEGILGHDFWIGYYPPHEAERIKAWLTANMVKVSER